MTDPIPETEKILRAILTDSMALDTDILKDDQTIDMQKFYARLSHLLQMTDFVRFALEQTLSRMDDMAIQIEVSLTQDR